jgi:hypothetical protein
MATPAGILAGTASFPCDPEPEGARWFLQATEPQCSVRRLSGNAAHIRMPVSGEVIVPDPDIPATHRRVSVEAEGANTSLHRVLDGPDLRAAASPPLWEPVPGERILSLVHHERRAFDTVRSEVRPGFTTVDSPPPPQR